MWAYQTSSVRIPANSAIAQPVRLHRLQRHQPGWLRGEAVVARGDGEAGGHPLQVVLERARQRLVEVVQTEQELPLGRRETAEVGQVRITAELDLQAGGRRAGQIGRHHLRRPPVEGERRHHHPAVPHRHQIGLAGGGSARSATPPDRADQPPAPTPHATTPASASPPVRPWSGGPR